MGWPAVRGFVNGDKVIPDVLNAPINQLSERTDYLYNLLKANDRSKVVVSASVTDDGYGKPVVGQPVYRIADGTGTYAKAAARAEQNAWFYADQSAMAVGVVSQRSGDAGATVVLYGMLTFDSPIEASTLIVDDSPASGRYYLSATAGKLTASPSGPVIYIGDCQIEYNSTSKKYYVKSILVNPQYRDTGESHIHREFVIDSKPCGGYAAKGTSFYYPKNLMADGVTPATTTGETDFTMMLFGTWADDSTVTYKITIQHKQSTSEPATSWGAYEFVWTSGGVDGSGSSDIVLSHTTYTDPIVLGTKGMLFRFHVYNSADPQLIVGKTWTIVAPDTARCWSTWYKDEQPVGYYLNLAMYPAMARYVPPVPANGASLSAGGVELRGAVFGDRKNWEVVDRLWDGQSSQYGGPWLVWYGGEVSADSVTTPFIWTSNTELASSRDIVYNVNRMRVGPTGFVTSLQPAEGSAIKITSAQTGEDAVQGALQIDLDVDFETSESDVEGCQVVKQIEGSKFKTGPVVEKIVAGPGISASPAGGQGTVTLSVSNAVYAGDFETIALKNAKQDLAGGVFPYTKLLNWSSSGTNTNTGFTAKFRVPDHIPYKKYNVIVSASVFGESAASSDSAASFSLASYFMRDYACSLDPAAEESTSGYGGSIASPTPGASAVIPVTFASGYAAFDPVLVHGFSALKDITAENQRQYIQDLLLKDTSGNAVVVYPGYFVGLDIARCGTSGTVEWYTASIGFLSLRWNLVEAS